MIAPPLGLESKVRAESTVTLNDWVAVVYPDLLKVRVMSYSPGASGVPDTMPELATSQEAPETVMVYEVTLTVGL